MYILLSRFGFQHIGRVGSVFATLTVTIERFVAVVFPLQKLHNTRKPLALGFIGTVVYNIPRFLEFRTIFIYLDANQNVITNLTNLTYYDKNITQVIINNVEILIQG